MTTQAKLLRFLDSRQFKRVGGTRDLDVDIVYGGWDFKVHVWDMPFAYDRVNVPWPTHKGSWTSRLGNAVKPCSMGSLIPMAGTNPVDWHGDWHGSLGSFHVLHDQVAAKEAEYQSRLHEAAKADAGEAAGGEAASGEAAGGEAAGGEAAGGEAADAAPAATA